MLQEWLEELAEDEMKKTASSQFEEVLSDMDIPELKAFYEMNKEGQAPPPGADPFAPRMVQADPVDRGKYVQEAEQSGRIGGGVLGGTLGGLGGAMGGAALGRRLGGDTGAAIGGIGGGALGALGLGYGGMKGMGSLARRGAEGLSDQEMQAAEDYNLASELHGAGRISDEELELAGQRMERAGMSGGLSPQTQQIPSMGRRMPQGTEEVALAKGAEAKLKMAADTGVALARAGFLPSVIEGHFKEAVSKREQKNLEGAERMGKGIGGMAGEHAEAWKRVGGRAKAFGKGVKKGYKEKAEKAKKASFGELVKSAAEKGALSDYSWELQ